MALYIRSERVDRLERELAAATGESIMEAVGEARSRSAWSVSSRTSRARASGSTGRISAVLAHNAYLQFGKGFHPAALNLADCAAYAQAKLRDEPLLFDGEDFARKDIRPALGPA